MDGKKVFKTLDFWFIDTWNHIDQIQLSRSYIQMSECCIWVKRVRAQILMERTQAYIYIYRLKSSYKDTSLYIHIYLNICIYRLVSFLEDLSPNPSNSNITLRYSSTRSTTLKLIYIIQVSINQKSSVLNTFFPCIK